MRIAVIALGKIGLPLAVQFADSGAEVIGVDVNQRVVDLVNAAEEPFPGEAHLQEKLSELVPAGRLRATTDYAEAVPGVDVVVLVVPLFVSEETGAPDFAWMDSATRSLAPHLSPGTLVSYETTLPVGTTRNRWRPLIEELSGLKEGTDFHLVFSPERVLTGRVLADLRRYPKLIGGLNEAGAEAARTFYSSVLTFDERPDLPRPNGVWDLGSAEAAERQARRDHLPGRQHRLRQRARHLRRVDRHRRARGHRGLQLPALQPHPQPRHRGRRTLHPRVPAALPVHEPRRRDRAHRAGGQRREPGAAGGPGRGAPR